MIIGLVGFIGSGKGTVGDILTKQHGYTPDSFAAPLKDAVAMIFGWDRAAVEGDTQWSRDWREMKDEFWSEKFGYDFTPRLALQLMGTEAGRNVFHKDLWTASLIKRSRERTNVVVTDTRFRNEIVAIHNEGGKIIRIQRGLDPIWFSTAVKANTGDEQAGQMMRGIHRSEWDWAGSKMDYTIQNDSTVEDLAVKIEAIVLDIAK